MDSRRSRYRRVVIGFAGLLTVLGCWLPWLRKLPVGYDDGVPAYTDEAVSGLEAGFHAVDILLIVLVALTLVVGSFYRTRPILVDGITLVIGLVLVFLVNLQLSRIHSVDRYAPEPGIFLALAGGGLFGLLGLVGLIASYVDGSRLFSADR